MAYPYTVLSRTEEAAEATVKKLEENCKNKWSWKWLDEEVEVKGFGKVRVGESIQKITLSGKARCQWCQSLLSYKGKGISSLREHLLTKSHMQHLKTRTNFKLRSSLLLNKMLAVAKPQKRRRERKPNFSEEEVSFLLEEISFNKDILMSGGLSSTLRQKTHIWSTIAHQLSANSDSTSARTVKDVRKKWHDIKTNVLTISRLEKMNDPNVKKPVYFDLVMAIIKERYGQKITSSSATEGLVKDEPLIKIELPDDLSDEEEAIDGASEDFTIHLATKSEPASPSGIPEYTTSSPKSKSPSSVESKSCVSLGRSLPLPPCIEPPCIEATTSSSEGNLGRNESNTLNRGRKRRLAGGASEENLWAEWLNQEIVTHKKKQDFLDSQKQLVMLKMKKIELEIKILQKDGV